MEEHQKYQAARRKVQQKYHQSEKGKVTEKKYKQSAKGRAVKKKAAKKRYRTINGYLRYIYSCVKRRCNNPESANYKWYGGRGIQNKFKSVDEFVRYVTNDLGFSAYDKIKGLQIDRIDNDGHYEKGNIRFVTAKVNSNNRGRFRHKNNLKL